MQKKNSIRDVADCGVDLCATFEFFEDPDQERGVAFLEEQGVRYWLLN